MQMFKTHSPAARRKLQKQLKRIAKKEKAAADAAFAGYRTSPGYQWQLGEGLRAVDAGGLPLNVAVVNHIARELGLDVSRKARMPETIERIRKVMAGR